MIITQMFFDTPVFLAFVRACRERGINVPVIPGVMCIQAYGGFKRMTKFCKSRVPPQLVADLEAVKDDPGKVRELGIQFGTQMCRDLLDSKLVDGLHFYCLNLEKVTNGILGELGMLKREAPLISDEIEELKKKGETFIAFEYYPPRTEEGVRGLKARMVRMKLQQPLYCDVTWGAGGSTSDLTFDLVSDATAAGLVSNMHLTCTNMDQKLVDEALERCKSVGIRNICALRGDPPQGQSEWVATEGGFTCALDLVKYMRDKYADYFCISVSGYPEGHPNAITEVEKADLASLTDAENGRLIELVNDDGVTEYWCCRDAAFEQEMTYLKGAWASDRLL